MGISRMLKMQLLAHSAVKDDIKIYLRESGVLELTDVAIEREDLVEGPPEDDIAPDTARRLEMAENALEFLDEYYEHPSFLEKISTPPIEVSSADIENIEKEISVEEISEKCDRLRSRIRSRRDSLERSRDLVASLKPWKKLDLRLESLSTEGYIVQLWTFQGKNTTAILEDISKKFEYGDFMECNREDGRSFVCTITAVEDQAAFLEVMKDAGASHHAFGHLEGTPAEIIESESNRWPEYEKQIEKAEIDAARLVSLRKKLCILADHYRETIGLESAEESLFRTDSTFILEGWIRAVDRRRVEEGLKKRFAEVEVSFRDPVEGEQVPIYLDNTGVAKPYEFVTTLYGRPSYKEFDPTPLLAPFFILFFAMCLTDAGYGLTLSAVAAVILMRFKPSGGAGLLMKVLLMGGLVTALVGIIAGGVFGIEVESLPAWLQKFVFINPLTEPMKMLNISFIMGLVHMVFGMGVRMAANLRAGMVADAILDDLAWMLFLIVLAPLGYAGILGGTVPPVIMSISKWAVLGLVVLIFVTGGRHEKSFIKKILTGLVKFYDVVGYFGDVLSYARLLALGLATSAIAIAVNDIAAMVKGMPFYTGYVVMVLILIGGHAFNLAVNTLGAFVHSGRLQYLEFFSKFFTGGGREFRPFRSERQYSTLKKTKD